MVTDPTDGTRYITMEIDYRWEEPTSPDEEWSERSRRTLWYSINAYVVRRSDADLLFAWAQKQEFWGQWLPESDEFHDVFMGEIYWSPSYHERFGDQRGPNAFTFGDRGDRLPVPVVVASMTYGGVGTSRDCSTDEPEHCYVASPWLAEALHLRWTGTAADFTDETGAIVATDPSGDMPGARGLLINEAKLRAFLDREGYDIVWTVLGCKDLVGERPAIPEELHLNGAFLYRNGNVVGRMMPSFHTYP